MMKKTKMGKYLREFFYHTPLFLAKELYNSNRNVNNEILKHINDALIEFKKILIQKKIPKNENRNKIDIVEKILNFNKQIKVKDFLRT